MIKKIIKIQNVGKFANYSAQGDMLFRKMTIIYAENGMGKTTLAAIWRSLSTSRSHYVEERTTLGNGNQPKVELLLEAGKASFNNAKWDTMLSNIKIFDSVFVEENVYRGCYVEHEHKKNLHSFVLGEEGVNLAKNIESLDNQIRNHNSVIADKEREIKGHILDKFDFKEFLSLSPIADIDQTIKAKQLIIETLTKSNTVRNKSSLQRLYLPTLPVEEIETVLNKTIEDLSEGAEKLTRAHIDHFMDAEGESWVNQGLSYVRDNRCPFCGQSLAGNGLVEAYAAYFGAAYKKLKQTIKSLSENFEKVFSYETIGKIREIIASNEGLSNYWDQYVPTEYPDLSYVNADKTWTDVTTKVKELLEAKIASPLDRVNGIEPLVHVGQLYKSLQDQIDRYNQSVDNANALINRKKTEIATGDATVLGQELTQLKNTQVRLRPQVATLCTEYDTLTREKERLNTEKSQAKKLLDDYTKTVFNKYQQAVNSYLDRFGTDFNISKTNPNYQGGKPRCDYCICINGQDVEPGDQKTTEGTACFKNTLSSGDKTTLALAFFLARLDQDADPQCKIIIIDDPISSLDGHRKTRTVQEIRDILGKSKQVIVLSHDPYFLKSLCDNSSKFPTKTLKIFRSNHGTSTMAEWDVDQELQNEYFRDYSTLADYLEYGAEGDFVAIARCIRPLVEGTLRMKFPKEFKTNEWLGNFIENIRESKTGEVLHPLKDYLKVLTDINDYSKRFHHSKNPTAYCETTSDKELQSYVKQTLNLIPCILAIRGVR